MTWFDPAAPGFLRRMAGCLLAIGLLVLCAASAGAWRLARTPEGRFWTGVLWLELGQHARAEAIARDLVELPEPNDYSHYRLWAAALRRSGRETEQLAVFDRAVAEFPDRWEAQGHRCWYGSLFGDPRAVLAGCDRSIELAPPDDGSAHGWRALARLRLGDRAGAEADLEEALARWERGGYDGLHYRRRRAWLEDLRAGRDPLDEAALEALRESF